MNGLRNGLCRRAAESDVTSGQWQRLLRKLGPTLTPEYEYGQLRQRVSISIGFENALATPEIREIK